MACRLCDTLTRCHMPPAPGPSYYPQLLMLDRPRDIDPVLRLLERLECRGDNLRLLVWEYPRCVAGGTGGEGSTCSLEVLPGRGRASGASRG